jgi:hypothetical protein
MDSRRDNEDDGPRYTFVRALRALWNFLPIALAFLAPVIGVCIIGLAADNIDWGTGRGSKESNTVIATFYEWNDTLQGEGQYRTKMSYMPSYYDSQTFIALIVAGAITTIGGFLAVPLSVKYWRAINQSVKLGRSTNVRPVQYP